MKDLRILPVRNLCRRKGRSFLLILLTALLAAFVSGGSLMLACLTNGMSGLEARLGADIIVVPSSAKSKVNVDEILLNGTTGYFYMSKDRYEEILQIEGVETASPQLFLCSLKADCCTAAVQIIGIDQDTDFTIQPWLSSRYSGRLGEYEVVAGCEIGAEVGESIRIYGKNCKVVARLDKTGTGFDTAIYTSMDNLRLMMADAQALGINQKLTDDPGEVVSAVYIKVADGYSIEQVANDINIHVRKVEAVQTRSMLSTVAESLTALSSAARLLILLVWALSAAVLFAAFALIIGERRREFALLRMLGFSRRMLMRTAMGEAFLVSIAGSVCGIAFGIAAVSLFSGAISAQLSLPFLVPEFSKMIFLCVASLAISLASGMIASVWSAWRVSRADTGMLMREGY